MIYSSPPWQYAGQRYRLVIETDAGDRRPPPACGHIVSVHRFEGELRSAPASFAVGGVVDGAIVLDDYWGGEPVPGLAEAAQRACALLRLRLSPAQRQVYELIKEGPRPLSRYDLSTALSIEYHTVGRHLQLLHAHGYVELVPPPPGGRPSQRAMRWRPAVRSRGAEVNFSVKEQHP